MRQGRPGQSTLEVSADIRRIAKMQRLGMPLALYKANKTDWRHRLPGVGALLIGGLIIFYFYSVYEDVFVWWPRWQADLVPPLGICWICIGAWILLSPFIFARSRVYLFSGGLISVEDNSEAIRWDQIERVWKTARTHQKAQKFDYTIRRSDQKLFLLSHKINRIDELGTFVEREVVRRLLPRALSSLRHGDPVVFERIAVSQRGLHVRIEDKQGKQSQTSRLFPWNEITEIRIDDTTFAIYQHGQEAPSIELTLVDIPNSEVLRGLIAHHQHERVQSQVPQFVAYRSGQSVGFGRISLNKEGIEIDAGKALLPWQEVASVGANDNEVIIRRKGALADWYTFPLEIIPNAPLLQEMVNVILRDHSSE